MGIKPIRTEADYRAALREIETLMDAGPNTPKGGRLDALAELAEAYERKHYPMDLPDPIAFRPLFIRQVAYQGLPGHSLDR